MPTLPAVPTVRPVLAVRPVFVVRPLRALLAVLIPESPAALTACVILNPCLKEVVIGGVDTVENRSFRRSVGTERARLIVDDGA